MNSVGDNIGGEPRVGQHLAENTRIAMVERPHGVEGVRGVPRSRVHRGPGGIQVGVGMSQADADPRRAASAMTSSAPSNSGAIVIMRMCPRAACQKRSNSDNVGSSKIFRRMHAAPRMAEEWTFQMNAQGTRPRSRALRRRFAVCAFDRIRQPLESGKVSSSGAVTVVGKITGHAMLDEKLLHRSQTDGYRPPSHHDPAPP